MNQFVPADWTGNMGDALPPLRGEDDGLVELLWCSGHVVMQSQAPPRPAVRDLEPTPWFQYPIDESLEKDLFSEIFGAMPADGAGRPCTEEDKERGAADAVTALRSGVVPPPLLTDKAGLHGDNPRGSPASEAGESSVPTMGSRRVCGGSNQAQTAHVSYTAGNSVPLQLSGKEGRDAGSYHRASATLTSSLTWSRPSGASKRKQSEGAESPSEVTQDVESESADVTGGTAQKPTKAKRRRAAQVHNLSERRRRDRINEKMRALQELVPHCNKTDKASMLDEAIEYLKSLQLQVQAMWAMGGRMALAPAPVMFPAGAHQYMQRVAAISSRMPSFSTCRLDVTSGMGRRMVGRLIDSLPQLGQPMHLPDRSCMFCRRVFVSSSCPQHFAHHGEQRDAAAALGLMVVRHLDGWPLVAAAQLPEGFGEGVQVRNIDGQVYHPIHRRPLHLEGVDRDAAARPCA